MGVATALEYENAFMKLFPQGDYWKNQFADTESDVSLFCKAKLEEFVKFRQRMDALQSESIIETTTELIAEWERVLLGYVSVGLDITQRRLLLKSKRDIKLNRAELQKVADVYGLTITNITFPYRPAFCGHSRFGISRMASPAAFSVLHITSTHDNFNTTWWNSLKAENENKRFGQMRCGIDRLAFFPADEIYKIVRRELRRSAAGHIRCGQDRLLPIPLDRIRALVNERLNNYRIIKMKFAQSRTAYFVNGFKHDIVLGDDFFSEYIAGIIERSNLTARLEKVLIQYIVKTRKPFIEYETAISQKLLANHIPYFNYIGE
jgi:uncharacterized protein YmfQ (DUF2313 family)